MGWLIKEESGQGLVEYGLIIALIVIIGMVGLNGIGRDVNTTLRWVSDVMDF